MVVFVTQKGKQLLAPLLLTKQGQEVPPQLGRRRFSRHHLAAMALHHLLALAQRVAKGRHMALQQRQRLVFARVERVRRQRQRRAALVHVARHLLAKGDALLRARLEEARPQRIGLHVHALLVLVVLVHHVPTVQHRQIGAALRTQELAIRVASGRAGQHARQLVSCRHVDRVGRRSCRLAATAMLVAGGRATTTATTATAGGGGATCIGGRGRCGGGAAAAVGGRRLRPSFQQRLAGRSNVAAFGFLLFLLHTVEQQRQTITHTCRSIVLVHAFGWSWCRLVLQHMVVRLDLLEQIGTFGTLVLRHLQQRFVFRLDVQALVHHVEYNVGVAAIHSEMARRVAMDVGGIHVGSMLHQQLHDGQVAREGRLVQRRFASTSACVQRTASLLHQAEDQAEDASLCRTHRSNLDQVVQERRAIVRQQVRIRSRHQQCKHQVQLEVG